jgi:hypothetical protein
MAIIALNGYAGSGKDLVGQYIQLLNCSESYQEDQVISDLSDKDDWWLEDNSGWQIKKFAGKLKLITSILTGIRKENLEDQAFKKTYLGPEWNTYSIVRKDSTRKIMTQATPYTPDSIWIKEGKNVQVQNRMTVREFLQLLGTDGLRNGLHENVWVNALFADYTCTHADQAPNGLDCDNWIITDCRFHNEAKAVKDRGGVVIRINRPGVSAVNAHPSETSLDDWTSFDAVINNDGSKIDLFNQVKDIYDRIRNQDFRS